MLTKTLLQQLANASSYSKGEDYFYNNYVRRIKRVGNTFTGKVEGSELYTVSLTLGGSGSAGTQPDFDCDCPYDYDGICKHCVAFGLAVLDEFGPIIELADATSVADAPSVDLNTLWQQTTTDQKLNFLRQLLDKQPNIRIQLAQFAESEQPPVRLVFFTAADKDKEDTTIDTTSIGVSEGLLALRFDEDALEMDDQDYYSEESPDPTQLIYSVLSDYADQAIKAFREGRLTDALTVCMGVYEGTQRAIEPEGDEFGVIDDYPSQTWEVWNARLADTYTQLASRVLHPDQISQALNNLAIRVQQVDDAEENDDEENDDDDFYDEQAPAEIYYNLKAFEPVLLALVTDMPSARAVQQAIGQYNWQNRGTEYVQLRIADLLQEPDLWLQTADQFADHDSVIAGQLLQRRRQIGDLPVLLQTLHRLTKLFPKTFDNFILDTLDETLLAPGPDLTLYLTSLENRCRSAGQLRDYLKLRTFWTEQQRRAFADSLMPTTQFSYVVHPLFLAQVLQTEGRDDDLFIWLKTLSWHYSRDLSDILQIAANMHPNECMDLAMERISSLLENGKRDRGLYQTIAGWLAALNTIQLLKPQVAIFAGHLVTTYSRLSALRDELRLKGLVPRK